MFYDFASFWKFCCNVFYFCAYYELHFILTNFLPTKALICIPSQIFRQKRLPIWCAKFLCFFSLCLKYSLKKMHLLVERQKLKTRKLNVLAKKLFCLHYRCLIFFNECIKNYLFSTQKLLSVPCEDCSNKKTLMYPREPEMS